jgi:hypothetical protein
MATTILANVPADQVEHLRILYLDVGATNVEASPERDGQFTLIITFPDSQTHAAFAARAAGNG